MQELLDQMTDAEFLSYAKGRLKNMGLATHRINPEIRRKQQLFENHGKAWLTTEIKELNERRAIWDLSRSLKRSPQAILEKMTNEGIVRFDESKNAWLFDGSQGSHLVNEGVIYATIKDCRNYESVLAREMGLAPKAQAKQ